MAEKNEAPADSTVAPAIKPNADLLKVLPTLYIAVGGTGMEVLLRVRRRLMNAWWGTEANSRLASLGDFPLAQFLHFDLDGGAVKEQGKATRTDLLDEVVKFTDEEKFVETFDLRKYIASDDDLRKYSTIHSWFPLTAAKVRELKIDPSKGAGQIRALARLYFFDKYPALRAKLENKIGALLSGVSNSDKNRKLGLETQTGQVRVVVIASSAGGTGSGAAIDMGYLAQVVARRAAPKATVDLYLSLPTGFAGANKDRTEANTYAMLMELESCMRGGHTWVEKWSEYDGENVGRGKPYDDVFLFDTQNFVNQQTRQMSDVYEMMADLLFEDFASADFANRKRSVAVNQQQHKIVPYKPPVSDRYGELNLAYAKNYSVIGQSMLDTGVIERHNTAVYQQMREMLIEFFGIHGDTGARRADDKTRDAFLSENLGLIPYSFADMPELTQARDIDVAEIWDYQLTDQLLNLGNQPLTSDVERKVQEQFKMLAEQSTKDEWPERVDEMRKQLDRDVMRSINSAAETMEAKIERNRGLIFAKWTGEGGLATRLYHFVDHKEKGGLDYTISLIELVKDRLTNDTTGVIKTFTANALRYTALSDALRGKEYDKFFSDLKETEGKSIFGANRQTQAESVMTHLKDCLVRYAQLYLRAVASRQVAELLLATGAWLGEKNGVDEGGNAIWSGFVAELVSGRNAALDMLSQTEAEVKLIETESQRSHAMYQRLASDVVLAIQVEKGPQARGWANEAFEDFGGSQAIFAALKTPTGKRELLSKLRNKASQHVPLPQASENPIFAALRQGQSQSQSQGSNQKRILDDMFARGMPWVGADFSGDFQPKPDQFKCLIGVADSQKFEKEFGDKMKSHVPTASFMTGTQVGVHDSGVPGRLVCYIEFSGLPLCSLRMLENWRASYRQVSQELPTHVHRDKTRFVHPIQLSESELLRLAEDFKLFLTATVVGVLERGKDGAWRVDEEGEKFSIGNERTIRLDGFGSRRGQVKEQVDAVVELLTGVAGNAAMATVMRHNERFAYAPIKRMDDNFQESRQPGFAAVCAAQLAEHFRLRAVSASDEVAAKASMERARATLEAISVDVAGSEADAYGHEVDRELQRPKKALRADFLKRDAAERTVDNVTLHRTAPPPVPTPAVLQIHLVINGQDSGPCEATRLAELVATGQLTPSTLVWRMGMAQWIPANQLPEVAALFGRSSPPPIPAQ